jgi:hypothetical protein
MWPPQTENDPLQYVRNDFSWRFRGVGDTLYIPSRQDFWAIDAVTGRQRWRRVIDSADPKAFLAIDAADA